MGQACGCIQAEEIVADDSRYFSSDGYYPLKAYFPMETLSISARLAPLLKFKGVGGEYSIHSN